MHTKLGWIIVRVSIHNSKLLFAQSMGLNGPDDAKDDDEVTFYPTPQIAEEVCKQIQAGVYGSYRDTFEVRRAVRAVTILGAK